MASRKSRGDLLTEVYGNLRSAVAGVVVFNQTAAHGAGLHPTDLLCLCMLETHGSQSAGDLGRLLGQSSAAVTATIDRVERLGLVHRVTDPADRRRVIVEPDLERLQADVIGPTMKMNAAADPAFFDEYTNDQLQVISGFLGRLGDALAGAANHAHPKD